MRRESQPPQAIPNMPTLPVHQDRSAGQPITSTPSAGSVSEHPSVGAPSELPYPRVSTRTEA